MYSMWWGPQGLYERELYVMGTSGSDMWWRGGEQRGQYVMEPEGTVWMWWGPEGTECVIGLIWCGHVDICAWVILYLEWTNERYDTRIKVTHLKNNARMTITHSVTSCTLSSVTFGITLHTCPMYFTTLFISSLPESCYAINEFLFNLWLDFSLP